MIFVLFYNQLSLRTEGILLDDNQLDYFKQDQYDFYDDNEDINHIAVPPYHESHDRSSGALAFNDALAL